MKIVFFFILLISQAYASEMTMTGPKIATCSNQGEVCLELVAENATGTDLRPLWLMENVKAKVVDKKSNQEFNFDSAHATIDWDMNQVIFYDRNLKSGEEIRLTDIRKTTAFMRKSR